MSKMVERFVDKGETIYSMTDEILVECPRCNSCASITPLLSDPLPSGMPLFAPRRLLCVHCGMAKQWEGNSFSVDSHSSPVLESYFGLPLWLQTSCGAYTLWAYNRRHLMLIERYVGAQIRQKDPECTWINRSLLSHLPEWMIVASQRAAVLKAVDKLKRKK